MNCFCYCYYTELRKNIIHLCSSGTEQSTMVKHQATLTILYHAYWGSPVSECPVAAINGDMTKLLVNIVKIIMIIIINIYKYII